MMYWNQTTLNSQNSENKLTMIAKNRLYPRQKLRLVPFLQDEARIYVSGNGLSSATVHTLARSPEGRLYAGTEAGIDCYDPVTDRWSAASFGQNERVQHLHFTSSSMLWFAAPGAVIRCKPGEPGTPVETIWCGNALGLATNSDRADSPLILDSSHLIDLNRAKEVSFPKGISGHCLISVVGGQTLIGTNRGLYEYANCTIHDKTLLSSKINLATKSAHLAVTAIAGIGSQIWIGTADGILCIGAENLFPIRGATESPVKEIRVLAAGLGGRLWVGTDHGAALLKDSVWKYYAGKRWLPDDRVTAILPCDDGSVWIATQGGLAHITQREMSFTEKAAHYEHLTDLRHNRNGFVTECFLNVPGDYASFEFEASDNDGLWTALYLCAECFRYAVTGEEVARLQAQKSLRAMLELVRLTGISGFPARAIAGPGEKVRLSTPLENWIESPVDADFLYKHDTSSDEVDGHYLAWYFYSELVADPAEKAEIADVCRAVTNHILDHDYTLVGPTGERTSWGVWSPEKLNHDPDWFDERGLNSLEILSHLRVAMHLCGDARFAEAYRILIETHDFALNTLEQKLMPPIGPNNHSDDELAACAYIPLLLLETELGLRELYLLSMERTWSILRPNGSPFHNIVYGACTGKPCDAERTVEWLRDAPLDQRNWTMRNSQRNDVEFASEPDRFEKPQLTRPLPPSEIAVMRWNTNPYLADGGADGGSEMDGAFWLLPYWMGRYFNIFEEG